MSALDDLHDYPTAPEPPKNPGIGIPMVGMNGKITEPWARFVTAVDQHHQKVRDWQNGLLALLKETH